jgi:hypothetical protein
MVVSNVAWKYNIPEERETSAIICIDNVMLSKKKRITNMNELTLATSGTNK